MTQLEIKAHFLMKSAMSLRKDSKATILINGRYR